MPFACSGARHSCKPLGRCRPAQSPGNQRGDDEQNESRDQGPVISRFDAIPYLNKQEKPTKKTDGVSGKLYRSRPSPAATYTLPQNAK